jgi:DNA-binding response OmpR family regulator
VYASLGIPKVPSEVEQEMKKRKFLRGFTRFRLMLTLGLVSNPAETLSRDRLLDAVWGYDNYPNTRTVDTHIVHLRQKLEPNPEEPRFILTVHGSGYKFVG